MTVQRRIGAVGTAARVVVGAGARPRPEQRDCPLLETIAADGPAAGRPGAP